MTQSASISFDVKVSQALAGDINTVRNNIALLRNFSFADGSGLNQTSKAWSDKRTLAGAASDSLDLAGILLDAFGQAITFARIKAIAIAAAATNTDTLVIGGGTNAFASFLGAADNEIILRPGGMLLLAAPDATGYVVTASTGDILKIANSAASAAADYEIVLIGA